MRKNQKQTIDIDVKFYRNRPFKEDKIENTYQRIDPAILWFVKYNWMLTKLNTGMFYVQIDF